MLLGAQITQSWHNESNCLILSSIEFENFHFVSSLFFYSTPSIGEVEST